MRYRLQATHGTANPLTKISLPVKGWYTTSREAEAAARAYEEMHWDAKVVIHDEGDVVVPRRVS